MLAIYFAAIVLLVALMVALSALRGERHARAATVQPFESGMLPVGPAHVRFPSQFYLVAMFFVVFDLESVAATRQPLTRLPPRAHGDATGRKRFHQSRFCDAGHVARIALQVPPGSVDIISAVQPPGVRMMRAILTTGCLLAVLAAGAVHADCTPPDGAINIPDGNTATREQMIAAQHAVKAYDTAVKAYGDCLQRQLDAKVQDGASRVQLSAEYAKMTNNEIDRLQKVANKFNAELRAYKARSSG